jgi:hypothetical protein
MLKLRNQALLDVLIIKNVRTVWNTFAEGEYLLSGIIFIPPIYTYYRNTTYCINTE